MESLKRLFLSPLILLASQLFVLSPASLAETELMAVDRAFNTMAQTKGIAEAFDHYLAENALNLNGGYEGVSRDEVVSDYQRRRDTLKMKWWPMATEVADSGDLGYAWGRFIEHKTHDNGTVEEIHGKYITIWRKNSAGEWKSQIDMGSLNPPPDTTQQ